MKYYTKAVFLFAAMLMLGCSSGNGKVSSMKADEFSERIQQDDQAVVLDVRTPQEYGAGHIQGAKLIDFYAGDFKTNIAALDKSKHYYVYCRSGNRSGQTIKMMSDMGFEHVAHLQGGINTWTGETVKGN